jgi:hypothetical protein
MSITTMVCHFIGDIHGLGRRSVCWHVPPTLWSTITTRHRYWRHTLGCHATWTLQYHGGEWRGVNVHGLSIRHVRDCATHLATYARVSTMRTHMVTVWVLFDRLIRGYILWSGIDVYLCIGFRGNEQSSQIRRLDIRQTRVACNKCQLIFKVYAT